MEKNYTRIWCIWHVFEIHCESEELATICRLLRVYCLSATRPWRSCLTFRSRQRDENPGKQKSYRMLRICNALRNLGIKHEIGSSAESTRVLHRVKWWILSRLLVFSLFWEDLVAQVVVNALGWGCRCFDWVMSKSIRMSLSSSSFCSITNIWLLLENILSILSEADGRDRAYLEKTHWMMGSFENHYLDWAKEYCKAVHRSNVCSAETKQRLLFPPYSDAQGKATLPAWRSFEVENSEENIQLHKQWLIKSEISHSMALDSLHPASAPMGCPEWLPLCWRNWLYISAILTIQVQ